LKEWYVRNLGFQNDDYGNCFDWHNTDNKAKKELKSLVSFPTTTNHFEPSDKEFVVNYRVADLENLVTRLRAEGVRFLDEITAFPYGKFVHLLDPEGNKIELWEAKGY
jgi:predicted enzyme related to lactoylglutathione lyase